MTKQVFVVAVLMCLLCCCTAAFAADWFVATNGNDSNPGTLAQPFATLQGAVFYHAQPGDTVYVRAGTYTGLMNINGAGACGVQAPDYALVGGTAGAPITIRPYDGDFSAIFTGAVRLVRCKYITLMGLDMQTASGGHPLSITSGCTDTDYFSPDHRSHHIVVQNCKIHDGGTGSGQCKLQQSDFLTVQDCEFWNLGAGGAVLDCVYVDNCVFQRNYMHDNYASAGFVKGGSLYNVFDSNVYVNPSTIINWGFMPGGQTDPQFCDPNVADESQYTVIRNNIVNHAQRGALPSENASYCYAYNNLWYDCASYNGGYSYVTCISTGLARNGDWSSHFWIYNNIFYDPTGDMRAYGWAQGGSGNQSDWNTGYNNFYNNGQAITVDTSFINPNNETGSTFGDPHLYLTGSTPTTRQGWINYFRPLWDAQSNAMLKDKGTSVAGTIPIPGVIKDIEGNGRPKDSGWDIGPYEYQGTSVTPVSNFAANIEGVNGQQLWGTPGAVFNFTDLSSAGPTAWSWTFGDSTTSTAQNPSHTYASMGQYTVTLRATNSAGNNTCTKTNYITIKALNAAFTASATVGNVTMAVNFTDQSTNSPTAWSWSFGDSGTSTAQSPTHTYTAAGTYTVALTATNSLGNDTCTKTGYITVNAFAADFSANPVWGMPPLAVTFTDASRSNPTAWSWTFGDGGTSTAQNPSHTFTNPGYYSIALTSQNAYGSNTCTKSNYITACTSYVYVYPTGYTMDVPTGGSQHCISGTLANLQSVDGNCMVFAPDTSLRDRNILEFNWTAPSGYAQNQICGLVSEYRAMVDAATTDLCSKFIWPCSASCPTHPFPNTLTTYSISQSVAAASAAGNINSSGNLSLRQCNMPGTNLRENYTFSIDLIRWTVYLNPSGGAPVANFSGTPTTGTPPLAVTFTDSSTGSPTAWSWNFGDSNTSNVQNPSHTYTNAGNYTVALTATNGSGNNTCTKSNYITITPAVPVANFSGSPTSGNAPLAVAFTDSSTGTPTAWSWNFGDSTTSTVQNPSHTYTSVGTYTVSLQATNAGGNNTCTKTNYITTSGLAPVANFSGTPTTGYLPFTLQFTDMSTNAPTAWSWNFGDTNYPYNTSTEQNPQKWYVDAGSYTVSLTATNAYGDDTMTKANYCTPSIAPTAPTVNYSGTPLSGSAPLTVQFTDSTGGVSCRDWRFGDGNGSGDQNPSHVYANPGTYTVKLYVNGSNGYCNNLAKTDYITVTGAPVANFSGTPTSAYLPCIVDFTDASTNNPTAWSWDFGDTNYPYNTSTEQNPTKWYVDQGTFTVALTVTNAYGNDTMTKTNYITSSLAPNAPTPNFSAAPTSGTAPLTVQFTDSSTGAGCWDWRFGDGGGSSDQNPSHVYSAPGTYTVKLYIHGTNGYCNSLVKTNYITVNAPTPTFVAAGAVASGTGTIAPALPAGIATNDILLLFLETANQAISITNQNGGTWTQATNSPQSVGTAGGSNGTRLTVFWSRYNGTQGAPTASDSGDHQLGRIIAIRGATTSGDPCNITAGNTEATVDTSGAIAGATTTVANTLVVAAIATSLPDASGTTNFSAWTNANLSSLTERTDNTVTAGNGGGLGIATGAKATAGAYTTTAVTCATATTKAMMSVAIKP